ncbi:MAG: CAP domain-containing protein [Chloroflexi bacterium]|nr:CAP domain-containing protein [Chloroflexota bacterium]
MSSRIAVVFLLATLPLLGGGCAALTATLPFPTSTPSAGAYITYDVQPGDTLAQISTHFHMTIEQLITLNADRYPMLARDPSLIQPGWRLRVPAANASPAARATADADTPAIDLQEGDDAIISQVNTSRAQAGLPLLRADLVLASIADDRSADMIARNYFSHYDPQTGQEPLLRYLQAYGYSYQFAGENIAEIKNGSGWVLPWLTVAQRYSAEDLATEFVTDWLNSPEHRANIFSPHYRRTGVGIAVSRDGRRIVAAQVFSD